MKKMTLALVLIAAFCLFAVSPVMAYTWTTNADPYKPHPAMQLPNIRMVSQGKT